ncbi:MAG: response regulator [Xanthobacteraceae bacterium]
MNTPDRNSQPTNSRTVLVLDDDVLVRMPVVQFLRDCCYRVVEAASTDEAIVILQKTNIPVDVVLSEIDIPGSMNGFGFAQWARSVRPEMKRLLAGTPERTVRNAAELCEVGPTLKRPYEGRSPNVGRVGRKDPEGWLRQTPKLYSSGSGDVR